MADGLDSVELGVILGVSGTAFLLLVGLAVVCCYSRRKRKATTKRRDPERQNIQNAEKVPSDSAVVEGGIENPVKGEITDASKSAVTSEESDEVQTKVIVQDTENIEDLYAKVNKKKPPEHSAGEREKDTVNTDTLKGSAHDESVAQVSAQTEVSDQTNVSRNSPDGAPDPSLRRSYEEPVVMMETRKSNHGKQRHVSSTSTDVVSVDEDITKIHPNGQYLKVNHEISFSSEDERSSSASKPSVVFGEPRFSDDYDHLRFQTTKTATSRPHAVERKHVHDGSSEYSAVNRHDNVIIPPDSSGMARVFVNSDTSNARRDEKAHSSAPGASRGVIVAGHDEVFLDQSFDTLTGKPSGHRTMPLKSTKHGDVASQIEWTRKMHRYYPATDHMGRRYRIDLRDNVSTHTDGGYSLSEYVMPPPRYRYTSMSTLESVGRDRSQSLDEPIYYIPSRRSSMASGAYSVVAGTYNPRRHVNRRYVTKGKLHKPLSMMDFHRLKYRSYKGSLPPFNVPL